MYDTQSDADYLSESAGSIDPTPIKYPAVEPQQRPPKIRQVQPEHHNPQKWEDEPYEPYWKRMDVAPFSRRYEEPTKIPQS